jgi:hypothetical protein
MRLSPLVSVLLAVAAIAVSQTPQAGIGGGRGTDVVGFDSNDYPGDEALPALRRHFAFAGYWLNNPPGEDHNSWVGKRGVLERNGLGFLVLANGRLEAEIGRAKKRFGTAPAALGEKDAAVAVAAARREGFPARTVIFLDQEEGGRLTGPQAGYLFGWTEAVARSGYLPGVYASGQAVGDGPGKTITTVQDIRGQIAERHLHEVAIWVYQDACPPANGCVTTPPPVSAGGTPDVAAWQYAQTPRRRALTAACAKTYAADGNCYAPELPRFPVDLSVSGSTDPSHGR